MGINFEEASRAIKKGDVISIRHFLAAQGDANLSNRFGWTLLMCAALEGNTAICEMLIQSGAQLDQRNKFGDSAISLAAHTGHAGFVKLLIDSGASMAGYPFGSSFEEFLDWAVKYGSGTPEAMARIKEFVKEERPSM